MDNTKDPNGTPRDENVISEIKNTLEGIASRLGAAEKRINELEDPAISIMQNEAQQEKHWENMSRASSDESF